MMRVHIDRPATNYKYLWAKIVSGARLGQHCARGLIGPYVKAIAAGMDACSVDVGVTRGEFLYVCGVARGYNANNPRTYAKNLHIALRPQVGARARAVGYDGLVVEVDDAQAVEIPALPEGYRGLDARFTMCRNYQFAVSQFG